MGAVCYGILGPLEITSAAGPVHLSSPQLRRLLCRLLVAGGRPVSRGALYECLWGTNDGDGALPADSAGTLRLYVSRLRRALPPDTGPRPDGGGFRLEVSAAEVDASRFERMLAQGCAETVADPLRAAATLAGALDLWRSDALAEFRDEPWAVGPAVRLDELRFVAYERLYEARLAAGAAAELCGDLQQLADAHPLREQFTALLMLALYRSGRQGEALRAYSRLRERLVDELGIEPGPALARLESQVLGQDPGLDVPAPERASRERFEPARRAPAIPASTTLFVGRATDVDVLTQLVPGSRLVTLAGPAGAGKTRLALHVAKSLAQRYAHGVWLVELSGLAAHVSTAIVREVVASTLEVRLRSGELDDLEVALESQELLLVLDNCEHVLDAAREVCTRLMSKCPGITILTTSREQLHAAGETVHRVAPLGLPPQSDDAAEVAEADSSRLFVNLARSHRAAFSLDSNNAALVARLCRRLDGLPLALEMAAARLRVLTLEQIHERLDARFGLLVRDARDGLAHHRTLEALTRWSYDLLPPDEQTLFRRLSAFAPGFDLDIVARFAARLGQSGNVLEALASLVDKSLLVVDTTSETARYRMLETVRQYAADQLVDSEGEQAATGARDAHAACYLERAERTAPEHFTAGASAWMERTAADFDNLRAAIGHLSVRRDDPLPAARLMLALRHYFTWRGRMPELRRMIEALGDPPELSPKDVFTARFELVKSNLLAQVDPKGAMARLEELMPVVAGLPDRGLESEVVNRVAVLLQLTGDIERGRPLRERALELARESGSHAALERALMGVGAKRHDVVEALELASDAGDAWMIYQALHNLGYIAMQKGDLAEARGYYEGAFAALEDAGMRDVDTHTYNNLGFVLVAQGERERGRELLARGYDAGRRQQDQWAVNLALGYLAQCALLSAEYPIAAALVGACERHAERVGFTPADPALLDEVLQRVRGKLGDRRFESGREAGRRMATDAVVELATNRSARPVELRDYA